MTTALNDSPGRPLRVVYSPEDAQQVRRALDQEKGLWRAFLKARGALLGALATASRLSSSIWTRLQDNRLLRYASRALGWTLHSARNVGQVLGGPGIRSGLLWAALTQTGSKLLGSVVSTVAHLARRAASPLAKVGGWLLRLTGRPGAGMAEKVSQVLDSFAARARQVVSDLREGVRPYLQRDGLLLQAGRSILGARALSGLAKSLLPKPWNLLVRVVASVSAVPAGVRRAALAFLRDLLAHGSKDDGTLPPAAPAAAVVTDLGTERAQRQDRDVADLDEAVPTLQRYPAKKAAHKRR